MAAIMKGKTLMAKQAKLLIQQINEFLGLHKMHGSAWRLGANDTAVLLAKKIAPLFKDEPFRPGPVRTLADMNDLEIAALEAYYGCRVLR